MIIGYHVIFGTYGFWLPNDPRGSWSQFVGAFDLYRHGGRATTTTSTRSVARRSHDHTLRHETKKKLKYPAVTLTGIQARAVGRGFAAYFTNRSHSPCWACAIMPDHVHLVIGRAAHTFETVCNAIKGLATRQLNAEDIHPQRAHRHPSGRMPRCFARGQWGVFLEPEDVPRAIRYVENNPVKDGLPRQSWSFVTPSPYDVECAPKRSPGISRLHTEAHR